MERKGNLWTAIRAEGQEERFRRSRGVIYAREAGDMDKLGELLEVRDMDQAAYIIDAMCLDPQEGKEIWGWTWGRIREAEKNAATARALDWKAKRDLTGLIDDMGEDFPGMDFLYSLERVYGSPFDDGRGLMAIFWAGYEAGRAAERKA